MNIAKVSKSKGQSAVAKTAYIHRASYRSDILEKRYYYPTATDEEVTDGVLLPKNAPAKYANPEVLWNDVEKVEKQSNALLARRIFIALPIELDRETNERIVREYCMEQFVSEGMVADYAIHWKDGNPHAHILLTTRPFKEDGTWAAKEKKVYALDENGERIPLLDENGNQKLGKRNEKLWKRETVEAFVVNHTNMAEEWRSALAAKINEYLPEEVQHVDHRSYERQGKDVEPTVHHGGNPRLKALNEVIMAGRKKIEQLIEQLKVLKTDLDKTAKKEIKVTIPWKNFDATAGLPMVEWGGNSILFSREEYRRVDDGWNIEITLNRDEVYRVKTKDGFIRQSANETRDMLAVELPPMAPQQRQPQRRVTRQRQRDDDFEL